MNENNLKSLKDRTPKERQEIAKKGGLVSGQKRREKKALKECINTLLDQEAMLDTCDLYPNVNSNVELLAVKLFEQALKGNIGATKTIIELTNQETLTEYQEAMLEIKRQELDLKRQELELKKVKGGIGQEISDKLIFINVASTKEAKELKEFYEQEQNVEQDKIIINEG